nr:hypothetical protein [uncultured Schaedlerella sp.]
MAYGGWYKLSYAEIDNRKVLLKDGQGQSGWKRRCLIRQYNMAWEIRHYLKKHPRAAVVELGAGLSGRSI